MSQRDASPSPTPMDVLKQFRSIFNTVKQHFQQVENTCRISGAQLWALAIIVRQPGLRVSELARAMAVHQSTTSNLVERLVELKLVEKRRSENDQRVVHLYPLPAGIALIGQAPQPVEGVLPEALTQLSAENLAHLHAILEDLLDILQARDAGRHVPLSEM
ncbi:MAG: MarR family transcriptional regulator [Azovibrio sp.]|nr:MarR family transcriptional regulator [Azovibrio sp.]